MELVKWANEKGFTFKLTREEIKELHRLLQDCLTSYFVTQDSEHFQIELDEGK